MRLEELGLPLRDPVGCVLGERLFLGALPIGALPIGALPIGALLLVALCLYATRLAPPVTGGPRGALP